MKAEDKTTKRARDVEAALRLEYATLAWMALVFASAIALGLRSGSLLLLAFGFDSMVELASAAVMVWRTCDFRVMSGNRGVFCHDHA